MDCLATEIDCGAGGHYGDVLRRVPPRAALLLLDIRSGLPAAVPGVPEYLITPTSPIGMVFTMARAASA